MNKFSIKNQEEKVECLMWISDLYKDVYGFRPRGYNFEAWSFQELTDFVNDLNIDAYSVGTVTLSDLQNYNLLINKKS